MGSFGDYDEDLNLNPFFQSFVSSYLDLFSEAVLEKWVICVPKRDCLKHSTGFTIEDFTHHILKPLNYSQELIPFSANGDITATNTVASGSEFGDRESSIVTKTTLSSSSSTEMNNSQTSRKWNFQTLTGIKVAYDYNTLFLENDVAELDTLSTDIPTQLLQQQKVKSRNHPRVIRVLFEETFYTPQKLKYKVLCVASQLNSKAPAAENLDGLSGDGGGEDHLLEESHSNWTLNSLRDAIDFIWLNGQREALDAFDGLVKLFLHNHQKRLNDLPINVQRDLVTDLYNKCLAAGFKLQRKHKPNPVDLIIIEEENCQRTLSDGGDVTDSDSDTMLHSSCEEAPTKGINPASVVKEVPNNDNDDEEEKIRLLENFRVATETYILHSIYKYLITSLSSALAVEDSQLNKIIRNLTDLTPKDLGIPLAAVDLEQFQRAKLELCKLSSLSSPLTKLNCLKRALRQLQQHKKTQGSEQVATTTTTVETEMSTMEDFTTKTEPTTEIKQQPELCLTTDEMIPMFIWLIIKSTSVNNWITQLEFLKQFRLSSVDDPASENSFLLTTLEAALTHLQTNREFISFGLMEEERSGDNNDGSTTTTTNEEVEFRLVDSGQLPYFTIEIEEDEESPELLDMIKCIKHGNLFDLQNIINSYEQERQNELKEVDKGVDESSLCHPLCDCPHCNQLLHPIEKATLMQSAFVLKTITGGLTLCHIAAICGRPKIVEYLLTNGANPNAKDNQLLSPLHYAAARGHQNALLLLAHNGSLLQDTDSMHNTPLHYAALNGHEPCIKALIYYAEQSRQPLNLSCQNLLGDTPLHTACKLGFLSIVQILVENGASIGIMNNKQSSPADYAHNIHVTRILQRSLHRRSLCNQMTNHGDFINIEMMQKEVSTGVVMVISDFSEPEENHVQKEIADASISIEQKPTRKISTSHSIDSIPILKSNNRNNNSRRNSLVSFPSNYSFPTSAASALAPRSPRRPMKENSFDFIQEHKPQQTTTEFQDDFNVKNPPPLSTFEPEHLKSIPVEDLTAPPKNQQITAKEAQIKKRKRDLGIRKLFTAIAVGDIPLALFYLGIPSEELETADKIQVTDRIDLSNHHHPLCSCTQCIAKTNGLGLDIDIKNDEGLSPLHLAVMYNEESLVKVLLKYNANINLKSTFEQKSALELAYENKNAVELQNFIEKWIEYFANN